MTHRSKHADIDYEKLVTAQGLRLVCFQATSSAMLGAAVLSCAAIQSVSSNSSVTFAPKYMIFAPAVCIVAFLNYNAMTTTRIRTIHACNQLDNPEKCNALEQDDDFMITCLRYSDWLISMPLLAVEMVQLALMSPDSYALVNRLDTLPGILQSDYIYAIVSALAFGMIGFGFISVLSYGDYELWDTESATARTIRVFLLTLGLLCLIGLYIIIFWITSLTGTPYVVEIVGFSLVWLLYPIVFILQMFHTISVASKDIAFAVFDVIAKALFTVVISFQTVLSIQTV
jgi:bacteriorhodopsin